MICHNIWIDQHKTCLIMVGLPGRGKSFISKQLKRYLDWVGFSCQIFNSGEYRRKRVQEEMDQSFFNPKNLECFLIRENINEMLVHEIIEWLDRDEKIAIYDATNVTVQRRAKIHHKFSQHNVKCLFIESICNDPTILSHTVNVVKIKSPDYVEKDSNFARKDFTERVEHYKGIYTTINNTGEENQYSYIKIIDGGIQYESRNLKWNHSKILRVLMNQKMDKTTIYICRNGQTEFSLSEKIGGNAELTGDGHIFSEKLQSFFKETDDQNFVVFTSVLNRAMMTAHKLPFKKVSTPLLNEINAGLCDSMNTCEIRHKYPHVCTNRKMDKFNYRYPNGEVTRPFTFVLLRYLLPIRIIVVGIRTMQERDRG
ncbi:6-phosphofructo-2-kinase/fructose-2,6-bisphosphatase 3 [Thelohanellus kitauei]|uniref:6-phosphofructo-2-kinase/fructose-2, 6-bisphosphatase 3 n=1 Tax=Thelohanellus kitauei TaxID=669202 RepID=A0A0C2IR01_THEKT|nr:6-phosphofructo-2-kinase/fructose-2,6-bisphosphatase 3 [Thelohanellus kitauei]